MRVVTVPCLSDNYAYLVVGEGKKAFVVDPSEAGPVEAVLAREGLELVAILDTHHHWDHVGGNEALAARFGVPVYAHESDRGRVPGQTHDVREGQRFEVAGLAIDPLHVPGHTLGAVAYHVGDGVFTGDTLFIAGCGRLFEGTPEQMHVSLSEKIAALPPETLVYCGHEYTVSNLQFALHVEPGNADARAQLDAARARRAGGEPTVPSTLADELRVNPFLRVGEAGVRARFPGSTPADVLAGVRKAKDGFKAR